MTTYVIPLLAIIGLCAFWAIFQLWLARHDPDLGERSQKCGGCGRRNDCDNAADPSAR